MIHWVFRPLQNSHQPSNNILYLLLVPPRIFFSDIFLVIFKKLNISILLLKTIALQ